MRILKRTKELKHSALILTLGIPLFIINLILVYRGFSKNPSLPELLFGKSAWVVLTYALLHSVLLYFIARANIISVWIVGSYISMVAIIDLNIMINTKNYSLGFYLVTFVILGLLYLHKLKASVMVSYYQSRRRWFEGLPKPVAGLKVTSTNHNRSVVISNIDDRGCFVFQDKPDQDFKDSILLEYGNKKLSARVERVSMTEDGLGQGLKFNLESIDDKKDVVEFIDTIRSMGYVE